MSNLTKSKQIFLYVAPFPALVCFKIWAASGREPGSLVIAASVLFAYCAFIIWIAYRWDKPTYFDWTVSIYFFVALILLVLWPEAAGRIFTHYVVTGIYACLFTAAFFPPLFGLDPFTYHYAKKYVPEEAWGNPVFVTINRIMTYVWAGIFAICLVISLYPSVVTRAFIPIAFIVGCGLPFNLRFPNYYLKRLGLPSLAEQRRMAKEKAFEDRTPSVSSLPTSAWEAVSKMPELFSPHAAGDLSALIGFIVSGTESFEAYLKIEKGVCTLEEQPDRKPDLLIRTPSEVWLAISRKELDGQKAFMQQDYTAKGNLGILTRLNRIFGGSTSEQPGLTGDLKKEPTSP